MREVQRSTYRIELLKVIYLKSQGEKQHQVSLQKLFRYFYYLNPQFIRAQVTFLRERSFIAFVEDKGRETQTITEIVRTTTQGNSFIEGLNKHEQKLCPEQIYSTEIIQRFNDVSTENLKAKKSISVDSTNDAEVKALCARLSDISRRYREEPEFRYAMDLLGEVVQEAYRTGKHKPA